MLVVKETWWLKSGLESRAMELMQKMDDLLGPGAHEHPGWCGHAHFYQHAERPTEVMLTYPWRSRALHEDLVAKEEPILKEFVEEFCSKERKIEYLTELAVDVEHEELADPLDMSSEGSGGVAVVTGSSKGIGRGIALALARSGLNVAVNFRLDGVAAAEVAREIEALGRCAQIVQGDVTETDACNGMIADVIKNFGRVDVLVNNVGEFCFKSLLATSDDDWTRVLASNLGSVHSMSRAVIPHMRERRSGCIVNIGLSPTYNVRGAPNVAAYSIAKTGVAVYTRSLAIEEAPYGIRVNCVAPGLIDNGILPQAQKEWMERRVPMGHLGRPEDIGLAVAYLASPSANYVSGATLAVNGAWDWFDRPTDHDSIVEDLFVPTEVSENEEA